MVYAVLYNILCVVSYMKIIVRIGDSYHMYVKTNQSLKYKV